MRLQGPENFYFLEKNNRHAHMLLVGIYFYKNHQYNLN